MHHKRSEEPRKFHKKKRLAKKLAKKWHDTLAAIDGADTQTEELHGQQIEAITSSSAARHEDLRRQLARSINDKVYMAGLQCLMKLWMAKYNESLAAPATALETYGANQKRLLKAIARDRFPGGIMITNGSDAKEKTLSALENAEAIYNAVFSHGQATTKIDIMVKNGSGWNIYLTSARKEVEDRHVESLAYKTFVSEQAGINIIEAVVLAVNGDYVREGDVDPVGLFLENNLTGRTFEKLPEVRENIARFQDILSTAAPTLDIGSHCEDSDCGFKKRCWSHVPKPSIFDIRGNAYKKWNKWDLYHTFVVRRTDAVSSGIDEETISAIFGANKVVRVNDIPEGTPADITEALLKHQRRVLHLEDIPEDVVARMVAAQQTQIRCYLNKTNIFDVKDVKSFLKTLWYPMAHVDFEALFLTPVPMFNKTKPYENTPFQVSIHLQAEKFGPCTHAEFLGEPGVDPRRRLAEMLIETIPEDACILTYNAMFERGRMKELAEFFPEYREALLKRVDNIRDLMIPFQKKYVYNWEQNGSYSLKYVLPARCPELKYQGLDVQNGEEAAIAYVEMFHSNDPERITKLRKGLFAYCGLDTFAMVMLLQDLEETANPEMVNAARNIAAMANSAESADAPLELRA